jgi:ABC-type antimicrobial peptide transport system ATPase subunit
MLRVDGVGDGLCEAILVRNFSMEYWERQEERKKKSIQGKKRDGIRTAELNRRDQVTAIVPGPVSFERGEQRSLIR